MYGDKPPPALHTMESPMSKEAVASRGRGWFGGAWNDECAFWRMEPYYTALIVDDPPTSTILKARVIAAIHRSGQSITAVSRAVGLPKSGLGRRLAPNPERAVLLSVLDAVARALDLEPDDLMRPVLLDGDQDVLAHFAAGFVMDTDGEPARSAREIPSALTEGRPERWAECCIARLRAQGLLRAGPGGGFIPSRIGFEAIHDPTLRNV